MGNVVASKRGRGRRGTDDEKEGEGVARLGWY